MDNACTLSRTRPAIRSKRKRLRVTRNRWNEKRNIMKRITISLFVVSLISGCSTTPSSPEPHKTKFAFQCLQVTSPDSLVQELTFSFDANEVAENYGQLKKDNLFGKQHVTTPASITLTHTQFEELIKRPNIEIAEFPVVYAGLGESVTNDQTRSVSLPEDYDIVDGKVIAKEKIIKLGYSVAVTVNKIENGSINYHLNASHKELAGFDEYKTENGLVVKMPYFKGRSIDTDLTHEPNSWLVMGGLIDEKSDGKKINKMICVRIIPPNTDK